MKAEMRCSIRPKALLLLLCLLLGGAWPAHAVQPSRIVRLEGLSTLQKRYILAGKARHIRDEVDKAASALAASHPSLTRSVLLDDDDGNFEFTGFAIDSRDGLNPKAQLFLRTPQGQPMAITYEGFASVDGDFVRVEMTRMAKVIQEGISVGRRYEAFKDKKARFLRALDAQAGKLEGVSMNFVPRFEYQMGFENEAQMRRVLADTDRIAIAYSPNPDDSCPWVERDLKVSFFLRSGTVVEKYVTEVPLSVLR